VPGELGGEWAAAKNGAWGDAAAAEAPGPGLAVFESMRDLLAAVPA